MCVCVCVCVCVRERERERERMCVTACVKQLMGFTVYQTRWLGKLLSWLHFGIFDPSC